MCAGSRGIDDEAKYNVGTAQALIMW